jgi:hypothetical protein
MGQSRMRIGRLKTELINEEIYLEWMKQQPEDWRDE